MRKAIPLLATVLSGLLIAAAAQAQSKGGTTKQAYKWTDDKGIVHYGDSVPAEYSQREQRVLNSQGLEVQKRQAEMIITTQKDAVRFPKIDRRDLPILFMRVEIKIVAGADDFQDCVRKICFR